MGWTARIARLGLALFFAFVAVPAMADEGRPPQKEWTILVFLNGHNDLDTYGAMNVNAMERVGSSDQVNIVVQWASMDFSTTKRVLVQKDNDENRVTSPTVHDPGLVDMGDYRSLVNFVAWAKEAYPAKHYFIDVWNHGSGWHKRGRGALAAPDKDISFDDRFDSHITTKQLGTAMTEIKAVLGQKVDIYGSDACLMAMAEVAGEMADSVDVFLGAEEVEPGEGWPYDKFLGPLVERPTMSAAELARIHAKVYLAAYTDGEFGNQDVTMSAFAMEKFPAFVQAMAAFAGEVKTAATNERTKIMTAARNTQGYYTADYKDLGDFLSQLSGAGVSEVKADTIADLQAAIGELVIANEVSDAYSRSKGISFWMPQRRSTYTSYANRYAELEFTQATGWGEALNQLLPAR